MPRPWPICSCRSFWAVLDDFSLFIYGLLALGYVVGYVFLGRPALALVAFFAMGTPCLAALLRTTDKSTTR